MHSTIVHCNVPQIMVCFISIIQCGSRDYEGLGFSAQKFHLKISLTFPLQQFGSIG